MLIRFAIAALVFVLAAAAGPTPAGGTHDLLAVGVRVRTPSGETVRMAPPSEPSLRVYRALLNTPARAYLKGGHAVRLTRGEGLDGADVTLLFFGRRSRAGVAPVEFLPAETADSKASPAATAAAWALAVDLAGGSPAVTEAAAAVVLAAGDDDAAAGLALDALARVRPDRAAAAAASILSGPATGEAARPVLRLHAVRVLRDRLGGAAAFPDLFRRLASDDDELVRAVAVRPSSR